MGAIGDVVMTLPAARLLFTEGFEIHWICGQTVKPLLECYPWITLIAVDDKAILKGTPLQRARHLADLWKRLALTDWDLCATLYYDWRYRLLTFPARAKRRVALSRQSRDTNLVAGRSYADEFARLMLGVEDGYREQGVCPLRPDVLPASPLPTKRAVRRVAIVPGGAANFVSQQTLRRWPIERYVALALELQQRAWEIILLGGKEDAWVKPYFQNIEVIDCLGNLSIPEVISTCDTCDAVISHDTGPLHLAGLSHTSLVAIFGPTNPGNFLPRRPGVVGIWGGQELACRPCYDGRSFAPCQFAGCMHQVSADLVIRELDYLLDARSRDIREPFRIVIPMAHAAPNIQ